MTSPRFFSERDRRAALYARQPEKYHFNDEEPEVPSATVSGHQVDGYCGVCEAWMPAHSTCDG